MSDTTDREAVERPCPNCGVTLKGHSNLRYMGWRVTHHQDICIGYLRGQRDDLLARAEAAEAKLAKHEWEDWKQIAKAAEAERDAAVLAEREACAELCDAVTQDHIGDIVRGIGDDIRARSKEPSQ